jgi:hypothetical protein
MNLPNNNTIEILEEMKNFLKTKSQKNSKGNNFISAEISALDRAINLIKLIQDNLPNNILKKLVSENEKDNDTEETKENNYEVLYSFEKEMTKNSKLDISFIQHKEGKQIVIALKMFKRNFLKWAYQGKIKTITETLEEIIKKSNEIWKK